jgi:AcrR family transcriptional regulator
MPRKHSSRSGTEERRSTILNAALQCFNEYGLENTTVQDIQQVAKCSTGSLYHHFGSKEGIAGSLFVETFKNMNEGVLAELQRCSDARTGVQVVVTQICEWVSGNTSSARFLLQSRDIQFSHDMHLQLSHEYNEIMRGYFQWFTPFVEDGSMKSLPLDTYVPLIIGPAQEYARRWLAKQVDRSPSSLTRVFSDAAWNAVRGDV